jgi:thiol-disulfide isomerase/thioredoxin
MRQTLIAGSILLVAVAFLFTVFGRPQSFHTSQMPVTPAPTSSSAEAPETSAPETRRDVLINAGNAPRAPALAPGTWINSEPLRLEELRGRVVLVDFWTFGCYNCRNTLPALKSWDELYRNQGLTIIGVHTPEFDREKDIDNVREQVRELGLRYPVVTDNDGETWRAFKTEAWPTVVILDKEGRIRWTHIGEGIYDEQESVIQRLLAE